MQKFVKKTGEITPFFFNDSFCRTPSKIGYFLAHFLSVLVDDNALLLQLEPDTRIRYEDPGDKTNFQPLARLRYKPFNFSRGIHNFVKM